MQLEIFVDENLSGGRVVSAIEGCGHTVFFPGDGKSGLERGGPDQDWLSSAGTHNWVVLTADQKIKTRILERTAVVHAKVKMFVIVKKDMTGQQLAAALVAAMPEIERVAASPGPFIARVSPTGAVTMTDLASLTTRS